MSPLVATPPNQPTTPNAGALSGTSVVVPGVYGAHAGDVVAGVQANRLD